jgi:hypothetical protein
MQLLIVLLDLQVGIYSDEITRKLMLDSKFQFHPSYCKNIEHCVVRLLMNQNVSALLVPYADVLTASTFHVSVLVIA